MTPFKYKKKLFIYAAMFPLLVSGTSGYVTLSLVVRLLPFQRQKCFLCSQETARLVEMMAGNDKI